MTEGRLVLLVSGPHPDNEGSAGVAAAGLLWELRHVAGVPVSAVLAEPRTDPAPVVPQVTPSAGPTAASPTTAPSAAPAAVPSAAPIAAPPVTPSVVPKGGGAGAIVELAVTGLFSATTIAAIAQVTVAFVRRGAARQITLRDGRRSLSITDPSEETERVVREWLAAQERDRTGADSGAD